MKKFYSLLFVSMICATSFAQLRPNDKTGINVFETPKSHEDFEKLRVEFGGGLTQSFQALSHENSYNADKPLATKELMKLTNGFNIASANLDVRGYLSEGITLNLELYLATRHHHDTWVKGGYIQIDAVPFMKSDLLDMLMSFTTVKIGQMGVNYGDAHYRRSDGGNTIFNPFVENYIMDAFATEIGAEVILQYNNFLAVGALTNGQLNPELSELEVPDGSGSNGSRNPALIFKLGYDKQFTTDLRARLTGSSYYTKGSGSNTLYSGDRSGSHYFGVMTPRYAFDKAGVPTTNLTNSESGFTSGRFNPGYGDKVASYMGNLFVKYKGLEWFSTLEKSSGRSLREKEDRSTTQIATDLVYRFGGAENFWVGGRYNKVTSELVKGADDVKITRVAASAGWFPTKNLMTKLEYVNQKYDGYAESNVLHDGKFNGVVFEAAISF